MIAFWTVLDRGEQHDEVEWIELRELPFSSQSQGNDQERVDHNRPQDFFSDRQAQYEHVAPEMHSH